MAIRAALTAGASPAAALGVVDAPSLHGVQAALRSGASLPTLVRDDVGPPTIDPGGALVRALAMAEIVGAPAGPAVDGILESVAATARLDGLVRVRSAQALLSARFLVGMPLAGAALLALIDPSARAFITSTLGMAVAVVAGLLIAGAHVWIRRLVAAPAAAAGTVDPLVDPGTSGPDPTTVVAGIVGVVASVVAGPAVGLPAALVLAVIGGPLRRRVDRASSSTEGTPVDTPITPRRPGSLPTVEALELLGLALSAGPGLSEACRLTAALAPLEVRAALRDVAARLSAGHPPAEAFGPRLDEVASLIDITHRWGAPAAQALRTLADDLRSRAAVAAEEAAERLAVRLVLPTTLLLVPAFGLLVVLPAMASTLGGVRLGL